MPEEGVGTRLLRSRTTRGGHGGGNEEIDGAEDSAKSPRQQTSMEEKSKHGHGGSPRQEGGRRGDDYPLLLQLPGSLLDQVWPSERTVMGLRVSKTVRTSLLSHGVKVNLVSSRHPGQKAFCASLMQFQKSKIALKWSFKDVPQFKVFVSGIQAALQEHGGFLPIVLLNLSLVGVGGERVIQICKIFQGCSQLHHLDLSYGWLGEEGAKTMALSLGHCRQLKHLDLCSNDIGPRGSEALAQTIGQLASLEVLLLENNRMGDQGLGALAAELSNCTALTHLNVSHNDINPRRSPAGPLCLGPLIESCPGLTRLALSHERLDPSAMQKLQPAVSRCPNLSHLTFRGSQICAQGMQHLEIALRDLVRMTHLDLFANSIRSEGAMHVAKAMQSCPALQHVELSCNDIGDTGVAALAAALAAIPRLTYLSLSSNSWGAVGAQHLVDALQRGGGKRLSALDCRGNPSLDPGPLTARLKSWPCVLLQ